MPQKNVGNPPANAYILSPEMQLLPAGVKSLAETLGIK
jgi:hypothetical protein